LKDGESLITFLQMLLTPEGGTRRETDDTDAGGDSYCDRRSRLPELRAVQNGTARAARAEYD